MQPPGMTERQIAGQLGDTLVEHRTIVAASLVPTQTSQLLPTPVEAAS